VKKGEDRAVIDTNLLVRFLTEDDPEKAKAVETLLGKAGKGEIKILIHSVVIAELVWVLKSFYEMEAAEISELVGAVLSTPGLDTQDKSILREALKTFERKGIDFVDAWILEFARERNIKTIYTFDKKHFKETDLKIASPPT
jgi:predicted nucleic-acid-binding protein